MDVYEFLEKLAMLYESDKDAESFKLRSELYSKILNNKEVELKKEFDYDKMLNKIACNYSYKSYPNLAEILNNVLYKKKEQAEVSKFKPKCYIVQVGNNIYEFEEVQDDSNGVHKLSDFEIVTEKKS